MRSGEKMISALFRDVSFYGVASVLARSVLTFLSCLLSIMGIWIFWLFYTTTVIITFLCSVKIRRCYVTFMMNKMTTRAKLVTQTVIFQTSVAVFFILNLVFERFYSRSF